MLKVTQAVERKSREIFSAIVGEEITKDWHMAVYRLIVSAVSRSDAAVPCGAWASSRMASATAVRIVDAS